jgi:hypothetical protein
MAKTAAPWMMRWRRRAGEPEIDWADLGTAIGMEMSLQPADEQAQALAARSVPAHRWWRRFISGPVAPRR